MGLHSRRNTELYIIPVLLITACLPSFTRTMETERITVFKGDNVSINCTFTDKMPEGMTAKLMRGNHNETRCYFMWQHYEKKTNHCKDTDFGWDPDKKQVYFIMKNISLNDSDIYSCDVEQVIPPPSIKITEGNKTYVRVFAPPTVDITAVSLPGQNSIQLTCIAKDFFPSDIEMQWHKDGQIFLNGTENSTTKSTKNVSFSFTSILAISASDWKENELFSCLVNHSVLESLIVQNISWQNYIHAETKTFNLNIWVILAVAGLALLIASTILVLKKCVRAQLKSSLQSSTTMPTGERATTLPVQESKATDNAIYSMVGEHRYHHTA
ncbi:immunoglobulin lambda-1 light chain-like [Protopterus annectens]|uniref:immunoglobulin lambda-1 light chain-like n=1 Tax=Protopterus annectens TaxID=7888 RepID=UPI001CFB3256|nr:immunoglobulin lambda-1 light chain-like [Protopterus annectens]